jgi:hypothetical protein
MRKANLDRLLESTSVSTIASKGMRFDLEQRMASMRPYSDRPPVRSRARASTQMAKAL